MKERSTTAALADAIHNEGWPPRHPPFSVRRGDFRFLVLMALGEKPMHGYALIHEIGKTYLRPVSAGIVYPTHRSSATWV